MSSAPSPDLRFELRTDWRVIVALLAWTALAIGCVWSAALPDAVAAVLSVLILLLARPVVASQLFVRRRGGMVLVWLADQRWFIQRGKGTFQPLEVSPASRGFPGGVLLLFRVPAPVRWLLLLERAGNGSALRRLRLRLNLVRRRNLPPGAGLTSPMGAAPPGGS